MQIADRITSPGLLIAAPLAYGAFRLSGNVTGATYALRAGEAMVLGTVVTSALKLTLGRARPYASARSDDWALGRGVRGAAWQAFPSGHTTVAFATASALTLMAAQHSTGAGVMVGAVTLAGASAAGVARLYLNKHWATDVLAGAGVGLLAGAGVMAWHRSAGGARLDRALLGVSITDGAMRPLLGMW
jgi:membrane-associated phospholipid phosphatase